MNIMVSKYIHIFCPELAGDEDFVQEIYMILFEHIRSDADYSIWLHERNSIHKICTRLQNWLRRAIESRSRQWKKQQKELECQYVPLEETLEYYDSPKIYYSAIQETFSNLLDTLSERERKVLFHHFGLGSYTRKTLDDTALCFGVSRERIRQIENKAFRKMRHPSRTKHLKDFYCYFEESEWTLPNAFTLPRACVAKKKVVVEYTSRESPYASLTRFLEDLPAENITLTLKELEKITPIPPSAWKKERMWRNRDSGANSFQAAWLDAHFQVSHIDLENQTVTFEIVYEEKES